MKNSAGDSFISDTHRQTRSFLMTRLSEVGIHPDTRKGQNFLIDLNLVELLARSAELKSTDVVLEVGTGTGSLTAMLAAAAAWVITVEVDPQLHQLASEELADVSNVTMLHQDVLKNKNRIAAEVLQQVQQRLAGDRRASFKLVANLPYNIATPLISNLLDVDPVPSLMVVTIQKELADRITAQPSTKDYSALSVWVQSLCDASIVRVLPPTVFWPRPKVHSAILRVEPSAEKRARIPDVAFFHQFVRAMFFHRRKFLRGVVHSAYRKQLDKPAVDEILSQMQLAPDARAEQLSVDQMLALAELVRARVA